MAVELVTGSADAQLIDKWDRILRTCQQERIRFEKQWYENMSFFFGRQWIVKTNTPNGFALVEETPKDNWRVRHTANRILRIIRTEVTKLSKEEPIFGVRPDSTDEKDRLAAMAGEAIADYVLHTKYFNQKRLLATFWACICGTSFIKNYYDENKPDVDGMPGRIDFEAVSAFHLFTKNLQSPDLQSQPFVAHARTMDPEAVYNCFGIEVDPRTSTTSSLLDSRYLTALGIKTGSDQKNQQCYVKEIYIKPNKEFPKGATFTYAEDKMLYVHETMEQPPELQMPQTLFDQFTEQPINSNKVPNSKNDPTPVGNESDSDDLNLNNAGPTGAYEHEYGYGHGDYPFAKIDHIPSGMFYADSTISQLISPQKEYNRTRSLMLEHRNLAGKPQYWYTSGSIDPRKFNSKPGLLLAVQMGFEPPKPLEQPPLLPNITNELQIILGDMDDISAQYEITKGRTPPGVEAASAIAYLSEENDTLLYHTVQSLENAVQETGIQVLSNVHDYWPIERIVRATSKNQFMEVRQFKKEDLNPRTDLRVETGSMAPKSLAAKQAFITELVKMGLPLEKGLRYLQMTETTKLYEDIMIDARHAQRENVYMSEGQQLYKEDPTQAPQIDQMTGEMIPIYKQTEKVDPSTGMPQIDPMTGQPVMYNVTVNPFDNHEAHVEEHQNFQKTQEYELLPAQIKEIIQGHVDEHKMELIKESLYASQDAQMKGQDPASGQVTREAEPEGAMSGPSIV